MSTVTGPRHITTKGAITLDKDLYSSTFQKAGTITAQIRQVITTDSYYPSKQIATNMQDNLFSVADFGFEETHFQNVENRIAWLDVPIGTTKQMIEYKLIQAMTKGACIYRILSNHPILDNHQQYAVSVGLNGVTLDTFANTQVLRYPKGHAQEGQIRLGSDNKVIYRRTFFSIEPKADSDKRTTDPADVYVSPEIKLELAGNGVMAATITTDTEMVLDGQEL